MYKKLNNEGWEKYINEYYDHHQDMNIKDYCILHNLNKSQFYYHRRRIKKIEEPILQAVKLENKQENRKQVDDALEVNIAIGNANISIPVSETTLITSIIKELAIKC